MTALLLGVGALVSSAPAAARAPTTAVRRNYIRTHYTKVEVRIPMRDGVRLFTAIYLPNDRSKRYPMLLTRTPYRVAPYGADRYAPSLGPSAAFERAGYIFVQQDVRGRFMSEGRFVNMRPHIEKKRGKKDIDESSDTYDTVTWLLRHVPRHNGRVGLIGISYPGYYASCGAIDGHPAIKAVSPQAPIADWFFDDMHRNGAFVLPLAFNFLSRFGVIRKKLGARWPERFRFGTPDGYQFFLGLGSLANVERRHFKGRIPFWTQLTKHPNKDRFWQQRNILPHLRNMRAAVLVVGGWYDTEDLYGTLATYRAIEGQNRGIDNRLVVGPWSHGAWERSDGRKLGDADFGFATAVHYRQKIELPFFEQHLRGGKRRPHRLPEALAFETGAQRWRHFDRWPPRKTKARTLYLRAGGQLAFAPPSGDAAATKPVTFDSYLSDPHKPVPYTMRQTTRWSSDYMTEDQRFAARRPDVLVYRGPTLKADLTVAGPLVATLYVSTSQSAADWVIKLIDEHPGQLPDRGTKHVWRRGGQQLMVRGEVFRGRFRDSFDQPKPFEPGKVTRVRFTLPDVLHTFKRGHRLVVQIQSSWFPLIDRNPQRYVPNIFEAKATDFVRAMHRVYRSAKYPSQLRIGILPAPLAK